MQIINANNKIQQQQNKSALKRRRKAKIIFIDVKGFASYQIQ